jgi:hypothetical protein
MEPSRSTHLYGTKPTVAATSGFEKATSTGAQPCRVALRNLTLTFLNEIESGTLRANILETLGPLKLVLRAEEDQR